MHGGSKAVKRYLSSAFLVIAILLSALSGAAAPGIQTAPPQYFPETGHTVREPFITYFNQTGGLSQHGYPITDDFIDPLTGLLMQYFEKSRIEWHPGNADPYRVQLGLLGDDLGKRQAPIPISKIPAANDPNCQYFPETGHKVCNLFREFWLQNGALDRFGYPITEFTIEDGWTYFLLGWTRVISDVFNLDIPTTGPLFDELSRVAAASR